MPSIDCESKHAADDLDNASDYTSDDGSDTDSRHGAPYGPRLTSRRNTVMATPLHLERGWTPPQYPKSASDRADIRQTIRHNCLFANLDEQAMSVMIDAMQRFQFKRGAVLIHQGDEGDQFFVLASGSADVYIDGHRVGGLEADTTTNFCGELALLYDSPRAATIKATSDIVAWGLDRVTFKKVLMDTTIKQRKLYEAFIDEVPILSELTKYERLTLVDALRPVFVEEGQLILEEGSQSNDFYIISDGEVTCTKRGEEVSRRLGSGDYFGEIALLSDEVRQATVTAARDTTVLVVDRSTFKRLLGPLESKLAKNVELYDQYVRQRK
ncbi:hypothetical protein H310_05304 [Aphanomyces invadans]|uniref:Cyclic nucleotide-binding domain-containing protein n=1 Tax=Aphanomyces invadans TaxID=157072 RepID=A0A024U9D1_9STRA|nr:hypothetical protein H310_05304 [Aphanomyces invadans]ETW02820.1 hypothetical protein H310_05304 [Aphanomyces invadans]|eukprot:XP_008868204.1 hypothetical protein H310_05304 [Aphanomyces invadans]